MLDYQEYTIDGNGYQGNGNGYHSLNGDWALYYKVASRFTYRVKAQDKEDILHTIIMTLADVERNNGHKPFTEAMMYRIASRTVADYWRTYYKANKGLDCGSCSRKQRRKCREANLYTECPKAIKVESLNQPIIDSEGNTTELGELIAECWDEFAGDHGGMEPQKLLGRMEDVLWRPPYSNSSLKDMVAR